jgi:hypothetical protein
MRYRLRTLMLFGVLTPIALLAVGGFTERYLDQATATLIGICILMPAIVIAPIVFFAAFLDAMSRGVRW